MQKIAKEALARLQGYVNRIWYPPLMAVFAAADAFLVVIPTDGILVSSTMATPRRWVVLSVATAIGSTVGALLLAAFARHYGLPWVELHFPGIAQAESWLQLQKFLDDYGVFFLFLYSATPLPQQPAILLSGLGSHISLGVIGISMFLGRLIKFLIMAYIGAKAPWLLTRLWGIKGDLKDVGIDPDKPKI